MDNVHIFEKTASLLGAGRNVALVTVIATSGSTPGKVGYKMLVFGTGPETAGTVGGGLVEAKMIAQAKHMLSAPGKRVFQFDLGRTPDDENGICGGSVEFLVETFDQEALPLFQDLAAAVRHERPGVLLSIIAPDESPCKILVEDVEKSDGVVDGRFTPEIVSALTRLAVTGQGAERISAGQTDIFIEPLAPPPTVVLFGAGHVSYHIAKSAKAVHFKVTVYDDRQEYANSTRFPDADDIVVDDFERALQSVPIDARSYVVIVTRGHKCDQIVLEQALQTDARYIGMIGSKRKTRTLFDKLRQKGFSEDSLNRVYSPIGLAVGAVTAEEIALSIVCELVKIRRLGPASPAGHMTLTEPGGDV